MPDPLTFCGRTFHSRGLELMRQAVLRIRRDRDRAHGMRVAGMEAAH
jgi:hypothetical protein